MADLASGSFDPGTGLGCMDPPARVYPGLLGHVRAHVTRAQPGLPRPDWLGHACVYPWTGLPGYTRTQPIIVTGATEWRQWRVSILTNLREGTIGIGQGIPSCRWIGTGTCLRSHGIPGSYMRISAISWGPPSTARRSVWTFKKNIFERTIRRDQKCPDQNFYLLILKSPTS